MASISPSSVSCPYETHTDHHAYVKLTITSISQDEDANQTTVNYKITVEGTPYVYLYALYVSLGNTTLFEQYSLIKSSWSAGDIIQAGTLTIPNNDDGSLTLKAYIKQLFYYGYNANRWNNPNMYQDVEQNMVCSTIPRYFSSTPTVTLKSKTETSMTFDWSTSENASQTQYRIGSGSWVDVETNINKRNGTITIPNLSADTSYNISFDFRRKDSGLWCQTKPSTTERTHAYPYISAKPNFTIGNTLTIGIYNPLGRNCAVYIVGADNTQRGGDTTRGTSISGYSNSSWTDWFYATIPNSNSGTYKVRLVCSEVSRDTTVTGGTYSTSNCDPTFTTFNVKDNNSSIVAVTGSDQVFVKGYSQLKVTIPSANKMVTQKSATPSSYVLSCDTLNGNASYSTSDINVTLGTLLNAGTKRVNVRAYDSRGNNALAYKDITVYDYAKPVINATGVRLNNFENQTTISIAGTYTRLTIGGTDKNTVQTVKYRYRETGGTWTNKTTVSATKSNGNYSCNDIILSLDNTKSYEFEIEVTDNISTQTETITVDIGQAIFFISTNNKACYINGQEILQYDVVDTW